MVTILVLQFADGFPFSTDWGRFNFLLHYVYFHIPVIQITFLIGKEPYSHIRVGIWGTLPEKPPICQYYKYGNRKIKRYVTSI